MGQIFLHPKIKCSKETLKRSSLMSNHRDFLVNMSTDVPLLLSRPYLTACGELARRVPEFSSCLRHVARPPRCERRRRRRLFMLPACVHSPARSGRCLKRTSRCPHPTSCEVPGSALKRGSGECGWRQRGESLLTP